MFTVLIASNHNVLSRYTPYFVGTLCAILSRSKRPSLE
jgi:hypothetical protein